MEAGVHVDAQDAYEEIALAKDIISYHSTET
jgi:hypothetical protein